MHECDVTHLYMSHDSCICATGLISSIRYDLFRRDTQWQRCIGYLKLQVSFCKRATNFRALLRKMIYIDKASYAPSPPCTIHSYMRHGSVYTCVMSHSFLRDHSFTCVTWLIHIFNMTHSQFAVLTYDEDRCGLDKSERLLFALFLPKEPYSCRALLQEETC